MLDKMSLPPLSEFRRVLEGFNIRKGYQYLLYFAKNEQNIYALMPEVAPPDLLPERVPTSYDRDFIIKDLINILTLQSFGGDRPEKLLDNKNAEVLILSAQRLIMGLIILGHVHIYEILIRELMPTFIKIIQREMPASTRHPDTMNKIRQFCKETITLLALWFPKCFYSNSSSSWFKKAVAKYQITIKFIVYFTTDKIESYENIIKQQNLYDSKAECLQCNYCLESSGKNYYFLGSIPDIPSVIQEEEEAVQSSIRFKSKSKSKSKGKNKDDEKNQPTSDSMYNSGCILSDSQADEPQPSGSDVKSTSKLSERIKRHREARRTKNKESLIKNSIKSRREYFESKSALSSVESKDKEKIKLQGTVERTTSNSKGYQNQHSSSSRDQYLEGSAASHSNISSGQTIPHVMSESIIGARARKGYLKHRLRQQNRFKYSNKSGSSLTRPNEKIETERLIPTYHSNQELHEDIYEISPQAVKQFTIKNVEMTTVNTSSGRDIFSSVFDSDLYKNMEKYARKAFRKECLRLGKKRLINSQEPWTADIRCRPKQKILQMKVQVMSQYAKKIEVSLAQPKNSLLLKQGKQSCYFNFEKGFNPIIYNIGKDQVLLPVSMISMLDPIEQSESELAANLSNLTSTHFSLKLDCDVFKNIQNVCKYLKYSPMEMQNGLVLGVFMKKYLFFEMQIFLSFSSSTDNEDTLSVKICHKGSAEDQRLQLLIKDLKQCLSKRKTITVNRVKKSYNIGRLKSNT